MLDILLELLLDGGELLGGEGGDVDALILLLLGGRRGGGGGGGFGDGGGGGGHIWGWELGSGERICEDEGGSVCFEGMRR